MPAARRSPRVIIAVAAATGALVALGAPAWAHVEADPVSVAADGAAVIDFGFHHGCDGAATTGLRIQIPAGVSQVVPQPVDGWTVAVSSTEFGWSGGSVPDGDAATFTADLLVSGQAGTVISFPTIQQCGSAEEAWVEIQEPGGAEPEMVAPSITLASTIAPVGSTVTTAGAAPSTATTMPSGLATTTLLPAGVMPEESETNTGGLIVGLVCVAIIAGGALGLYLRNRRPRPQATTPPASGPGPDDAPTGRSSRAPH